MKLVEWLKGKKTYIVIIITFIMGGLKAVGVEIPDWIFAGLGGLLGITFKAGQNRLETKISDIETTVKNGNGK